MTDLDGGPAFPVSDLSKTQCPGMTMREHTAVEMMAALIISGGGELRGDMYYIAASYASCAVVLADALLVKLKEATE